MNLELDKIKKELADIKKIISLPKPVRFFRVYYELEYLEAVDIQKLLEDMIYSEQHLLLNKVYAAVKESHNIMFDNPILKLSKYCYKITFWVVLHNPMEPDIFDKYFDKKIGKACSEPIQRYDTFIELATHMKTDINKYYEVSLFGLIEDKKVPKTITI